MRSGISGSVMGHRGRGRRAAPIGAGRPPQRPGRPAGSAGPRPHRHETFGIRQAFPKLEPPPPRRKERRENACGGGAVFLISRPAQFRHVPVVACRLAGFGQEADKPSDPTGSRRRTGEPRLKRGTRLKATTDRAFSSLPTLQRPAYRRGLSFLPGVRKGLPFQSMALHGTAAAPHRVDPTAQHQIGASPIRVSSRVGRSGRGRGRPCRLDASRSPPARANDDLSPHPFRQSFGASRRQKGCRHDRPYRRLPPPPHRRRALHGARPRRRARQLRFLRQGPAGHAHLLRREGQPGPGSPGPAGEPRLLLRHRLGGGDRAGAGRRRRARAASRSATPSRRSATSPRAHAYGVSLFAVDCEAEVEKVAARAAPGAKVFCRILCDGSGAPNGRCRASSAARARHGRARAGTRPSPGPRRLRPVVPRRLAAAQPAHVGIGALAASAAIFKDPRRARHRPADGQPGAAAFPTKYLKSVPAVRQYGKAIFEALRKHFGNPHP